MRREILFRLGELLYGEGRFGSQLAAGLTDVGPRKADQSQVSTWLNGRAEIPAWVAGQARALALKGQRDLARRAADLAELSMDPTALQDAERPAGRLAKLRQPHPDTVPPADGPPETD